MYIYYTLKLIKLNETFISFSLRVKQAFKKSNHYSVYKTYAKLMRDIYTIKFKYEFKILLPSLFTDQSHKILVFIQVVSKGNTRQAVV